MNPELAKQAAVVLGWKHVTDPVSIAGCAFPYWELPDGRQALSLEAIENLRHLIPEVARWCRENDLGIHLEGSPDGEKLPPDMRREFWRAFITDGGWCVESVTCDDPATALCIALVEADKKLKGEE